MIHHDRIPRQTIPLRQVVQNVVRASHAPHSLQASGHCCLSRYPRSGRVFRDDVGARARLFQFFLPRRRHLHAGARRSEEARTGPIAARGRSRTRCRSSSRRGHDEQSLDPPPASSSKASRLQSRKPDDRRRPPGARSPAVADERNFRPALVARPQQFFHALAAPAGRCCTQLHGVAAEGRWSRASPGTNRSSRAPTFADEIEIP
jgi:hypothetical protein